jgi:hypothetical protein
MRRIANERNSVVMPAVQLQRFNCAAMDLLIALDAGRTVLDKS